MMNGPFALGFVKEAYMIKEAPFKSQAQRRKFYAMADSGEISKKTLKKWVDATPKGKKLPERVKKAEVDMDMFALGFFKQSVSVVNLVKGLAGRAMNAASPYAKRILAPLEGLKNKVVGAAGAGGAQVPESGRAATKELVHRVGQYLPKGGNFNPLEVMRRSYSAVAPVMHKARLARPPMRPSPVSVPREKFVSNSRWQGSSQ
jgi:hypothetical protein